MLAVIPETNSLLATANSYIGASNVGPSSPKENRKSSVMKDDTYRKSSVMKDDRSSSVMKNDRSSSEQSSSEEERRSSRRREKTRGIMQVETDTGQTAYTPRWQKTGSAMQMESRDPRSRPIPTACIPPSLAVTGCCPRQCASSILLDFRT